VFYAKTTFVSILVFAHSSFLKISENSNPLLTTTNKSSRV